MTEDQFTRLVLGALFHDIGKFKQRARLEEDQGKNHSIIGYEWLSSQFGEGLIASLARNHHAGQPETWQSNLSILVYEADNLSASERKEFDPSVDVDRAWHHEVLLMSDFSRVCLPGDPEIPMERPQPRYWPLKPLGDWIVPQETDAGGSKELYRELWEGFCADFRVLREKNRHYDVNVILHLLERYTSFVPSITLRIIGPSEEESFRKHPDVSLFDHSKVAAAVAACLYRFYYSIYGEEINRQILRDQIIAPDSPSGEEPFLLVGGDLSGVQKFIYTISSKGALKSLKGRSFFLELLTEHIVDTLIEELCLTRCNVLFTGGGHFYLLAPNTREAREKIESVRQKTNDFLWKAFNGNLLYCIAYVPMTKRSFNDASSDWAALAEKLDHLKRRKWVDRLDALLGAPEMPHASCLTASCEVCAREDEPLRSVRDMLMCPSCIEQFEFGEALQRAARLAGGSPAASVAIAVWEKDPPKDGGPILSIAAGGKVRYYRPLIVGTSWPRPAGAKVIYRLNDWNVHRYTADGDRPMMAGLFHEEEFQDLGALAQRGYGWNRIGVLRMDVDRLGEIFSSGFAQGDRTFSRLASLSRQLSLFFKYHVNGILDLERGDGYNRIQRIRLAPEKRDHERLVSIVYSGGDDLFLIGHWLDIVEAAFDIHQAFQEFTANPCVTLSAGIALGSPHYAVYRLAEDAGRAEGEAKLAGRNSVTILDQTLSWGQAEETRKIVQEEILPLLRAENSAFTVPRDSVSKGFFHRVLGLVRPLVRKQNSINPSDAYWTLPKVAYLVGRLGPSQSYLKGRDDRKEGWIRFKNRLLSQPHPDHLKQIDVAITWALMMMRKGDR